MKTILWPLVAASVVAIIGIAAVQFRPEPVRLDNFGAVPGFTMTDSSGAEFHSEQMKGKVWVLSFFFTSCPKVCPTLNATVAEISRKFQKNEKVEFVSISVDPETDTPAVLTKYMTGLKTDTARWHFLTGPMSTVRNLLIEGLRLGAPDDPTLQENMLHTTRLTLIDSKGDVRGFYQSTDRESIKELYAGITSLSRF